MCNKEDNQNVILCSKINMSCGFCFHFKFLFQVDSLMIIDICFLSLYSMYQCHVAKLWTLLNQGRIWAEVSIKSTGHYFLWLSTSFIVTLFSVSEASDHQAFKLIYLIQPLHEVGWANMVPKF